MNPGITEPENSTTAPCKRLRFYSATVHVAKKKDENFNISIAQDFGLNHADMVHVHLLQTVLAQWFTKILYNIEWNMVKSKT